MLTVTFYGVRGSTPCSGDSHRRYGGNTSCVAIESPGTEPIVLDLGTGVRAWGETMPADHVFQGVALITHLHWDHVQGLPFFAPINRTGARLTVYGPRPETSSLQRAFEEFMCPPYFPVRCAQLRGDVEFRDFVDGTLSFGPARVLARSVPHAGHTNGYRIELGGRSIAYISDHQQPLDGRTVEPAVLELCDGVDLLIHDAQYTADEFPQKSDWGHSTVDFALAVAREAGARCLALFHHDPTHDDDQIDRMLNGIRASLGAGDPEVIAAAEGLTVALGDVRWRADDGAPAVEEPVADTA